MDLTNDVVCGLDTTGYATLQVQAMLYKPQSINEHFLLLQIERAVRDGFDVRGMFYWTLIDNFVSLVACHMHQ